MSRASDSCRMSARDRRQLQRRLLGRRAIATLCGIFSRSLLWLFGCGIRRDLSERGIDLQDHARTASPATR
jgi:hypothetical protein